VQARTDLAAGFARSSAQLAALAGFMRRASLSGIIRDPQDKTRLQLACSVYVRPQQAGWLLPLFAFAAGLQAAEAHRIAAPLAEALCIRPAWDARDAAMGCPALSRLSGETAWGVAARSGFGWPGLDGAAGLIGPDATSVEAGTDDLVAVLPLGGRRATLRLSARRRHPDLGGGLSKQLEIPAGVGAGDDPAWVLRALRLNEREQTRGTCGYAFGSWCPTRYGLSHVAFFPNRLGCVAGGCVSVAVTGDEERRRRVADLLGEKPADSPKGHTLRLWGLGRTLAPALGRAALGLAGWAAEAAWQRLTGN
jgi:hypothetical protein